MSRTCRWCGKVPADDRSEVGYCQKCWGDAHFGKINRQKNFEKGILSGKIADVHNRTKRRWIADLLSTIGKSIHIL